MKSLMTSLVLALFSLSISPISFANEVGDKIFVATPKAAPIYTSKGGTKYWPCNGFINAKLINIIYEDLKAISLEEGVPIPSDAICHYTIGDVNLMGNSVTVYTVNYYTSKANMETCVLRDYCSDFRSMTFKIKNKKLHRQYFVTNINKKLTRFQCVEMTGTIASERNGC
jgi:hypothetical protein